MWGVGEAMKGSSKFFGERDDGGPRDQRRNVSDRHDDGVPTRRGMVVRLPCAHVGIYTGGKRGGHDIENHAWGALHDELEGNRGVVTYDISAHIAAAGGGEGLGDERVRAWDGKRGDFIRITPDAHEGGYRWAVCRSRSKRVPARGKLGAHDSSRGRATSQLAKKLQRIGNAGEIIGQEAGGADAVGTAKMLDQLHVALKKNHVRVERE